MRPVKNFSIMQFVDCRPGLWCSSQLEEDGLNLFTNGSVVDHGDVVRKGKLVTVMTLSPGFMGRVTEDPL